MIERRVAIEVPPPAAGRRPALLPLLAGMVIGAAVVGSLFGTEPETSPLAGSDIVILGKPASGQEPPLYQLDAGGVRETELPALAGVRLDSAGRYLAGLGPMSATRPGRRRVDTLPAWG